MEKAARLKAAREATIARGEGISRSREQSQGSGRPLVATSAGSTRITPPSAPNHPTGLNEIVEEARQRKEEAAAKAKAELQKKGPEISSGKGTGDKRGQDGDDRPVSTKKTKQVQTTISISRPMPPSNPPVPLRGSTPNEGESRGTNHESINNGHRTLCYPIKGGFEKPPNLTASTSAYFK